MARATACLPDEKAIASPRGDLARAPPAISGAWQPEGAALSSAWLLGGAVTNAWDPTAVLPSLGLGNALRCVARMTIDAASTRLALALAAAALAQQAVDSKQLVLELSLSFALIASWRAAYTLRSDDPR